MSSPRPVPDIARQSEMRGIAIAEGDILVLSIRMYMVG